MLTAATIFTECWPWPWEYIGSFFANLLALLVLFVSVILSVVLLTFMIGPTNGPSAFMLRLRIVIAIIIIPSATVGLIWTFRRIGERFCWYGMNSYQQQLVTHRTWPTTISEILFAALVIVLSVWWMGLWLASAFMLFMGADNAGSAPQQANGVLVTIMALTAIVGIFSGYVVGCSQTGWYGAFPPDRDRILILPSN
jgi:hypothetical protein